MVDIHSKKGEDSASVRKIGEVFHDDSQIVIGGDMIDKGILTNEEEKKLMDKEILNISQRSQKEVNENKTINKNPLVKEEEDNNNIIQVKAPEEAKKEITEEIIAKAGKLTIQVFIFLIC